MTIRVIEQTTSERNQEIHDLFQQIKPLLDQGYNYVDAYSKITGISKRNLQGTAKFKHLKKYGETQGYSSINYSRTYKPLNKHGLYNVRLVKQKQLRTGHHWQYVYGRDKYTGNEKSFTNIDLRELRKKVESRGYPWKVTDLKKAQKAYQLNLKLLEDNPRKKPRISKTGVKYVYIRLDNGMTNGYTWTYQKQSKKGRICRSCKTLEELKHKMLGLGEEWIVVDPDKYNLFLHLEFRKDFDEVLKIVKELKK